MSENKKMMQLVAAIPQTVGDKTKNWWSRIGVGWENRDGSWNLKFDYLPARISETTIQLRPFNPKEGDAF